MTALNTFCREPDPVSASQVLPGKAAWIWARGELCRKEAKFGMWLGLGMMVVPATSALSRCRAVLDMLRGATDAEWVGYKITG